MSWRGPWRNQYGSEVEINENSQGRIEGVFRTALKDSSFYGQSIPIRGAAFGDVIGFTAAGDGNNGPAAVSYTGILREGKLETLWHTVAGTTLTAEGEGDPARLEQAGTWRAFGTSLDSFERVS